MADAQTAKERAFEIANQSKVFMFGSVDEHGDPFIKAMLRVAHDGLHEFWFCSNTCSKRRTHILNHPSTCLYFHEGFEGVMLKGTAEISYDDTMRTKFWDDAMLYHYPQGPADPDYMLVKFTASEGNYYSAKHNENFPIA